MVTTSSVVAKDVTAKTGATATAAASADASDATKPVLDDTDDVKASAPPAVVEPKGDPEMAPLYLKRLLPVFTQVYQRTMIASVR